MGATTQSVSITLNGDLGEESNETFYLDLIGITNGVLVDSRGLATIIDDDRDPGTLSGGSAGGTGTPREPHETRRGTKPAKPIQSHTAKIRTLAPDAPADERTDTHKRGRRRG